MPATRYLHSKLEHGPRPIPTFGSSGFRTLETNTEREVQIQPEEVRRLERMLRQTDCEVDRIVGDMKRLYRVIAELEVASALASNAAVGILLRESLASQ